MSHWVKRSGSVSLNWYLLSFPIFWLGLGNRYPFVWLGDGGRAVGAWFWMLATTVWVLGFWFAHRQSRDFNPAAAQRWVRVYLGVSLSLTPALDLYQSFHFEGLGYQFPTSLLILDAVSLMVSGFLLWTRPSDHRILLGVGIAFAALHAVGSIQHFPINPHRSDMLATIGIAAKTFLEGGHAYSAHLDGWRYGIGYLPGMWMSFLPASALSVDLRWMNVFWLLGIGGLVWKFMDLKNPKILGALCLWFFNPYLHFRHDLYLGFFWWVCLAASLAVARRQRVWALVAISAAALSMYWAWVLAPFWVMTLSRSRRELVANSLVVAAALSAGLGFFYWREGDVFFDAVTVFFRIVMDNDYNREFCLGYSLGMSHLGLHRWMSVLQKMSVLAAGIWGLVRWNRNQSVVGLGLATFWGFCLTVEHQENYQYLLPMLLMPTLVSATPDADVRP